MKFIKLSLLILVLLITSCAKEDFTRPFDQQINTVQTSNNQLINSLNQLTTHVFEPLQAALDTDINQAELSEENSEILKLVKLKEEAMTQVSEKKKRFDEELTKLKELDQSQLDKANDQLKAVLGAYDAFTTTQDQVLSLYTSQIESEKSIYSIISKSEPSIQELEDQVKKINENLVSADQQLKTFNEQNNTLQASIENWKEAIDPENEVESETTETVKTPETQPVETPQPEPTPEPDVAAKYTIDSIFRVVPLNPEDNAKVALLTFDDSPQTEGTSYSLEIAKTLKEKGVSAIFFVNGMYLENEFGKNQVKQISDLGFTIANHTYSHPHLDQIDLETTRTEIKKTNDLVEEITGKRPTIFRPTFGVMGEHTQQVLDEEGMIWFNWTYGYDWEPEYMEAEPLAKKMVESEFLGDGANLLMHDRKWTSEAIGQIVDGLQAKGFTIVDPKEIEVAHAE